jgi:hypothetical protein
MPSGYEKSPDYGNPPPLNWKQRLVATVLLVLLALVIAKCNRIF